MDTHGNMTSLRTVQILAGEHNDRACLLLKLDPNAGFALTPHINGTNMGVIAFLSPCHSASIHRDVLDRGAARNAAPITHCSQCGASLGLLPAGLTVYKTLGQDEWECGSIEPIESYLSMLGLDVLTAALTAAGLRDLFLALHAEPDFYNGNLDRLVEQWRETSV